MEGNLAQEEVRESTAQKDAATRRESLANLYQGFFTGIVRIQARRQQLGEPEVFRTRMKTALKDVRREAAAIGYPPEDVDDTELAVVAFLDEVILTSDDPARHVWAKKTLNVEMFGEAVAGEIFFERLESFRKRPDSRRLSDLLEVYLLCLLLGFEGRYAGTRGEIHAISTRLRSRIDAIRQPDGRLTPEAVPPLEKRPLALNFVQSTPQWKLLALAGAAAAIIVFLLLKLSLWWGVQTLESGLRS